MDSISAALAGNSCGRGVGVAGSKSIAQFLMASDGFPYNRSVSKTRMAVNMAKDYKDGHTFHRRGDGRVTVKTKSGLRSLRRRETRVLQAHVIRTSLSCEPR
jgi:hypothetical protein